MDQQEKPKASKEPTKPKKPIKSRVIGGHSEELVDHYWGSINYVFSLIKASEIKAGLILSFYGILLNFIFQNIGEVFSEGPVSPILLVLLGLLFLCMVVSIYFSIRCFMPRIEGNYDKNMFFFGDVISKFGTIQEFSKTFYKVSLNEEKLFDQLGQQIYVISKIAAYKFRNVNRSLRFLALGLALLLVVAVYHTTLTLL